MDTKIKSSFWTDPAVEALDGEAKFALLYLFTAHMTTAGWAEFTRKRFQFDTDLSIEALERACLALGKGIVIHQRGWWAKSYIRHQIGVGPKLVKNNQAQAVVKCFEHMPAEIVAEVLNEYPELKDLVSPTQVLTKDKRGEERRGEEQSREEGLENGAPNSADLSPEAWAEKAVALFVKKDNPMGNRQLVAAAVRGGASGAEICKNITEINGYIAKAPDGRLNGMVPSARSFFEQEQWREPSNFANRWNREESEPKDFRQKKEGGGPAMRSRMDARLEEPPCAWRDVLCEGYPDGVNDLAWGLYMPELRAEIVAECKRRNLLRADWTQPPITEAK